MTQQELDEAILGITGLPEWHLICGFLVNEALQTRDQCADAKDWGDVQRMAGFAEGIAFVVNLREMTERVLEETNANV